MVVAVYLLGRVIYQLRDAVLLNLVAGFVALLLNPVVGAVQRLVRGRGPAVAIVTV